MSGRFFCQECDVPHEEDGCPMGNRDTLTLSELYRHIHEGNGLIDGTASVVIRGEKADYAVAAAHWDGKLLVIDLGVKL